MLVLIRSKSGAASQKARPPKQAAVAAKTQFNRKKPGKE